MRHKYMEYKSYLDSLRDSGKVNMMGAGDYLVEDFDEVTRREAKEIVLWYIKGAKEEE